MYIGLHIWAKFSRAKMKRTFKTLVQCSAAGAQEPQQKQFLSSLQKICLCTKIRKQEFFEDCKKANGWIKLDLNIKKDSQTNLKWA